MMKALYLGLDPSNFKSSKKVIHYPLIEVVPRPYDSLKARHVFSEIPEYTHILFTSKTTVQFFFEALDYHGFQVSDLKNKKLIAIGKITAAALQKQGAEPSDVAKRESSEGVVQMLSMMDLEEAYFFFPRSSLAKPLLAYFLALRSIRHQIYELYDTVFRPPKKIMDLKDIDEIIFTSPSTVDAFLQIYKAIPEDKIITTQGPVTDGHILGNSLYR